MAIRLWAPALVGPSSLLARSLLAWTPCVTWHAASGPPAGPLWAPLWDPGGKPCGPPCGLLVCPLCLLYSPPVGLELRGRLRADVSTSWDLGSWGRLGAPWSNLHSHAAAADLPLAPLRPFPPCQSSLLNSRPQGAPKRPTLRQTLWAAWPTVREPSRCPQAPSEPDPG